MTRRFIATLGLLTASAALGLATLPSLSCDPVLAQQKKKSRSPKVELSLGLPKSTFLVSEDREMSVSVTNRTASTIEIPTPFHSDNWQPTYTITGPGYPKGYTFSFRSVALNDKRPEPAGVPAVTIRLAPGEKVEKDVPLHEWAPIRDAGSYEIVMRLEWKGLSGQSEPLRFEVGASKAASASVGVDVGQELTSGEWVEWFGGEGASRQLYTALFERPHVDMHGYKPFSISPLLSVSSDATDLLSPWTNYDRQSELAKWRAWREGSTLLAYAFGQKAPQRLQLESRPRYLVRPALMTAQGELDVFAVDAGGALVLARFPDYKNPQSARILWRQPIETPFAASRATLSSEALGSQRRVVVVSETGDDLSVLYMNAESGARPSQWLTTRIPNARPIPNTEPAFRIDTDGRAHAAIPFRKSNSELAIADLSWSSNGTQEGQPKITELGSLESSPTASAASYVVAATGVMRRNWIVMLEDGSVIYGARQNRPRRLAATPAMPLQLVLLDAGTYLLTIDASGTPGFTLLD